MSEDVNLLKTVELVFRRPSTTHDILPTELADIQRVSSAKLLGVEITQDINFCQHTESIVTTWNQRLYLLAQLRRQNLSVTATDNIFQAIILSTLVTSLIARNISCNKYVTEPSTDLWLYMTTTLRSWQKKLSIISFTIVAPKITASVTSTGLMTSQVLWGYVQGGTILCFPSLKTILIRRILLSEPCTIIYRMCSGLSYGFTMCFKCFSVLLGHPVH